MHCEARGHGVHVTVLCPGFVRRGAAAPVGGTRSVRLPEFVWLDREEVAREALEAVAAGKPVCVPGGGLPGGAGREQDPAPVTVPPGLRTAVGALSGPAAQRRRAP
ncbi:hypothetical protein GCM10020000_67180 [Streptomyces olivoverticillatus]